MEKVFRLTVDLSQNIDDIPNVHKINRDDYLDISQILASENYSFNESQIIARANFNQIKRFDYIANDLYIPILSERMVNQLKLKALDSVEIIPLVLVDDTYLGGLFSQDGLLKQSLPFNHNFFTINFKKQFNFCNKEFSIFRKLKSKPNELGILKKPVLNVFEKDLPSLFRIKESISFLFVSEEAYSTVQENNLKGCVFEEVKTICASL